MVEISLKEIEKYYGANQVLRNVTLDILQAQLRDLERQMAGSADASMDETLLARYGRLQERFEAGGGYIMEDSMNRVCTGLKIDARILSSMFSELSGGEKTRVLLGKLFLTEPDILLLDEPTNHLDLQSLEWLEEFLAQYRGTVVVISHDRYFINRFADRISELQEGRIMDYDGDYEYYRAAKASLQRSCQTDALKGIRWNSLHCKSCKMPKPMRPGGCPRTVWSGSRNWRS